MTVKSGGVCSTWHLARDAAAKVALGGKWRNEGAGRLRGRGGKARSDAGGAG